MTWNPPHFSGVETTLCLIQAALAWCENPDSLSLPLAFSSAIIRFLNLTSHVGMNKFGLKKIHEVAEKFSIPGTGYNSHRKGFNKGFNIANAEKAS